MYLHQALIGFIAGLISTTILYSNRSFDMGNLTLAVTVICGGYIGFLLVA